MPFHLNFDYETAYAEVPHKKGILRFAPPELQQVQPTYFSSWEENWSFSDFISTHPGKEESRSRKKRMTLAQPHALLNRNGHIFPVSHCGLRILLKNRGFPPPSLQAAFQQDSIQKPLFSTPLSIHSIHFIQFIQFTFISTSYEGIFTCSGRPRKQRIPS